MGIMDEYLFSKEEFDVICTELRFNDIKVRARIPRYARMPRHASMAHSRCLACFVLAWRRPDKMRCTAARTWR